MSAAYTFRKMLQSDKKAMLAICAKIWDGNDFLHMYYDEWVADKKGEFTALLHDGKLVGCAKLTFLTETDAWLQGLRKDPDAGLKGVASAVNNYYIEKLRDYNNLTSIRFSSWAGERSSIVPSERIGFRCIKKRRWRHLMIEPANVGEIDENTRVEKLYNSDIILEYIHKSGFFQLTDGLINLAWTVYPYSDELVVESFIKPAMCYGIIENGQIKAMSLIHYARALSLSFFDADDISYAREIIEFLKIPASKMLWWEIQSFIPGDERLMQFHDDLGFVNWTENEECLVYEYPLELLYSGI